jgi:hypothetical protein
MIRYKGKLPPTGGAMKLMSAPDDDEMFEGVPLNSVIVRGDVFYVRESEVDSVLLHLRGGTMLASYH